MKETLVFHRDYITPINIFTNHFVHEEFMHIAFNIISYVIVAILLWILSYVLKKEKIFYKLFLINLTIVPIVISLIWIPVNQFIWIGAQRVLGFSGIISSFCGMLIYTYIFLLYEKLKINTTYAYLSSLVLIPLLFYLIYWKFSISNCVIMFSLSVVFIFTSYKTIKSVDKKCEAALIRLCKKPKLVKSTVFILYFLIFLFSLALFPTNFIYKNVAINFFIHYVGFIIGIVVCSCVYFISIKK
ncbi:MAG: hypothetical protein OH333_05075 [Candidatus Parvarchaeota archaeon]|nr:hypothetical protein [Candidatus Jingweiarchaeum tengchongense]